jgi:FHA domain
MASLRILNGSLEGEEIELSPDPQTIGRGSSCNIKIGDAGVSSKHAKIWCEDGAFFLMDLGSTNGTFVNDRDVDREQLSDGDTITFGETKARFVADKPKPRPAPARAAPPPARAPARPSGRETMIDAAAEDQPPPQESRRTPEPALRAEVKTADEVEIATLRGKIAFFEEENRKLKAQIVKVQEQAAHDAAASARAEAEKLRAFLKQKDEELKRIQKELDEKETYYSPAELERERKRMEQAIEAERRRDLETLQRQIKELEHRVAIRGAESDTVARQLKEKDDLIKMLSEREDEIQSEIKGRDAKVQELQDQMKALKEGANAAAGKEKELNDKLKQKNAQLAQLGKERGELVQELAKARLIISKLGGADEAAAAVEEQQRATKAMQDRIAQLEGDVSKARDAASVMGGKLDAMENEKKDLLKQIEDAEANVTDAVDARMKVEGQLSEMLRRSGDRDSFEKQQAMLKADRDARAKEAQDAVEHAVALEAQLSKIRGTYDDIVRERDELKAHVDSLEADARMAQTSSQLGSDWEARYKSASDELADARKQLAKMKAELAQAKEQAAKAGGGGAAAEDSAAALAESRAQLHGSLVLQMLDGVNNSVSLLRRNSELLRGYVEDCGLLANAVRRVDYTRLEPSQQQMLVELIDQTQPEVIVKNMQGISEENAESIVKAKKLILDYSDAFKKEEVSSIEMETAFAKAQGLFHAIEPQAEVPVKIEAVLPPVEAEKQEAVLWAFALLREAKEHADEGKTPAINVDTDGLTITATVRGVDAKMKDRYRELPDPQARLVRGFAIDRCGGKIEFKDDETGHAMVLTLKAKM